MCSRDFQHLTIHPNSKDFFRLFNDILNTGRWLSLPNTNTNTRTRLLPFNLSPYNLPSHLSPATQALLGLLEALALLLLFAIDPHSSGGTADGNGEDWVQSSEMKKRKDKYLSGCMDRLYARLWIMDWDWIEEGRNASARTLR